MVRRHHTNCNPPKRIKIEGSIILQFSTFLWVGNYLTVHFCGVEFHTMTQSAGCRLPESEFLRTLEPTCGVSPGENISNISARNVTALAFAHGL